MRSSGAELCLCGGGGKSTPEKCAPTPALFFLEGGIQRGIFTVGLKLLFKYLILIAGE